MKSLPKSFVTLMAGWGFWVLAALYIVVDLKKWWTGSPFSVVGMNSILLYILHETLADQIPFCGGCGHVNDSHEIRMAMNVGAVTVWVLYAYYIRVGNFKNRFRNQDLATAANFQPTYTVTTSSFIWSFDRREFFHCKCLNKKVKYKLRTLFFG